ncbi:MAG: hypothetical protein JWO37_2460 [Acidimicrobiales bacterium]|jgi:hypothetical protein|nr:hypothetical protein [Acidimicrobiales bacterium]
MVLAELEIRHSRAVAPTRRVALGEHWLPTDPAPGFGGILLAGVVAAHVNLVDDETFGELLALVHDLEHGMRIAQPRLRHRFQTDIVGLDRSRHTLRGDGERLTFEFDDHAGPVPQILGAVYAASQVGWSARPAVFGVLRKGLRWVGPIGPDLAEYLVDPTAGRSAPWRTFPTDARWALKILGFALDTDPADQEVRKRFRRLIRDAHPDHGGRSEGAGQRILELTEARRILLGA